MIDRNILAAALAAESTEAKMAKELDCSVHELRKSVSLQLVVNNPALARELAGLPPAKVDSKAKK